MAAEFLNLIILFRDGAMPLNWSIVVGPRVFLSFIFLFFAPTYAGDYWLLFLSAEDFLSSVALYMINILYEKSRLF